MQPRKFRMQPGLLEPRYTCHTDSHGNPSALRRLQAAKHALHCAISGSILTLSIYDFQGYPYARPSSSFLYLSGAPFTFDDAAWKGPNHIQELAVTSPTGEHIRQASLPVQLETITAQHMWIACKSLAPLTMA